MKEEVHNQVIWNVAEIIKGTAIILACLLLFTLVTLTSRANGESNVYKHNNG